MARSPHGERIAVLETKFPAVEKELAATVLSLTSFNTELKAVRHQVDRFMRLAKPALWLVSATLLHATGGNVAKLLGLMFKFIGAAL
jgi:hypothetical protein